MGLIFFYAITFLTLPVIGLYFSLCCRNFITAFAWTVIVGMLAPLFSSQVLGFAWYLYAGAPNTWIGPAQSRFSIFPWLLQIVAAILCWNSLRTRLKKRAFPLERTEI